MTQTNGRSASVIARLMNMHRETGKPHQYLIDRFAQERFLYRLSTGKHRHSFVLKGGLLITAMTDRFYRATRDIDVRAFAENDPAAIKILVAEAIEHDVVDDGMTCISERAVVEQIRAQGEERGLRLRMPALLGRSARTNVQIDMGFADPILLPYEEFEYPVLLDEYPVPVIRAYSPESIIAEKLEAIASLDERTSRYQDYDDILELAQRKRFDVDRVPRSGVQVTLNAGWASASDDC